MRGRNLQFFSGSMKAISIWAIRSWGRFTVIDVYRGKKRIHSLKLEVLVFQPCIVRCHVRFRESNALIVVKSNRCTDALTKRYPLHFQPSYFPLETSLQFKTCARHPWSTHASLYHIPTPKPAPPCRNYRFIRFFFAKRLTGWIHAAGVDYLPQSTPFFVEGIRIPTDMPKLWPSKPLPSPSNVMSGLHSIAYMFQTQTL